MIQSEQISFHGLSEMYLEHREQILSILDTVLTRGARLNSEEISDFEQHYASFFGRRFAVAVGSATDGLVIALQALGIGPGDEVIVTSFSFIASASCILFLGATPVFVDVEPDTLLMDLNQVEDAITPRTRAIIAVQLYGQCLDFADLEALSNRYGVPLIEDAAQAVGSYQGKRRAGSLGRISVISFGPAKVVPGLTSGGLLCTDEPEIANQARLLRVHGHDPRTKNFVSLGYNSQMSAINAAVLSFYLSQDSQWNARRHQVAEQYEMGFKQIVQITPVLTAANAECNFHKYVVRVPNRRRLLVHAQTRHIPIGVHYEHPIPRYAIFRGKYRCTNDLPVVSAACREVVSLPIHPHMTSTQVGTVVEVIVGYFAGS